MTKTKEENYKKRIEEQLGYIDRYPTRKNPIDKQLEIFTRVTGGQIPHGLLSNIGKSLGVSRERVRQRAKAMGFLMSKELLKMSRGHCFYCNKELGYRFQGKYCSNYCKERYRFYKYRVLGVCLECGFGFLCYRKNPRKFCTRVCRGRQLGRTYGSQRGRVSQAGADSI